MICEFDEKKNLVRAIAVYQRAIKRMQADPSISVDAEFAANFSNWRVAKETAENYINGTQKGRAVSPSKPVPNIDTTGNNYATDISLENVSACYGGDQALYQQMQNAFQRKMLAASVLEIYADGSMEYRDPNAKEGRSKIDRLSVQIIAYKNELIDTIRRTVGLQEGFFPAITENTSDYDYQTVVNSALEKFAEYFEKNPNEKTARTGEGFDAYMILKNFDALLNKLIPYIKIDPSYGANNLESVQKYSFQPTIKHRTNFSKDEQSDITKQFGNLAETILKVVPDIDENGNMLSSNVGVSGFNGAMQTLKRALMTQKIFSQEDRVGFRKSVITGTGSLLDPNNNYNLSRLIDKFIHLQSAKRNSGTSLDEYRQSYLFNKLRSIKKYLLNPKTPNYIKNMFVQLFLKTEDSNYRVYNFNKDTDQFEGHSLKTNLYLTQQHAFEDIIKGGIKQLFESSSNVFATNLLSKYDVSYTNGALTIEKKTDNGTRGPQMSIVCDNNNVANAKFSVSNPELLAEFMLDAYGYYIPDTYANCIISDNPEKWVDDFAPYIALASVLAKSKVDPANYIRLSYDIYKNNRLNLRSLKTSSMRVAERLGVIYGESIKSTIKGVNNNSLPLYGLTSLQFNWRGLLDEIPLRDTTSEQAFGLFAASDEQGYRSNADMIGQQIIRNEVQINGVTKDANKMNTNELNKLAIIDDFWFPATSSSKDKLEIYMQNATFSDKGRQFLVSYDINTELKGTTIKQYLQSIYGLWPGQTLTAKQMIDKIVYGDSTITKEDGEKAFREFIRNIRRDKYIAAALNVLKAYSDAGIFKGYDAIIQQKPRGDNRTIVAKDKFASLVVAQLCLLDGVLRTDYADIGAVRAKFKDTHTDFVEETYAYEPKAKGRGKVRVNETLLHYCTIASDKGLWDDFIAVNKNKFAENISKLALSGVDAGCGGQVKALLDDKGLDHTGYYNSSTQVYKLVDKNGKLHSIANAYFYCDILFSQEFNSLTIGEIWAHPNKNKDGLDEGTYLEYSEANRLVNQIKRSVIFGSTVHLFGQGIVDDRGYSCGVTSNIDIAIIDDAEGPVYTINGADTNCDPQDGSGFCTALQSVLENNSLSDAAVGDNKKTIIHSIDPKTGTPTLLKWAVYSLTNSVRRNGQGSIYSPERLVQRMYSKALNLDPNQSVDLNEILDRVNKNNYYIWDNYTGQYKQLVGFDKIGPNTFVQNFADGTKGKTIEITTLYSVDQLFGGAFTYRKNDDGTFSGTEDSVFALAEFAIKYNQRDKQIAYVVNASACKVGATNVNSRNCWEGNEELSTYNISMKYGGVLMNADHDLDEAEVTEMSQMISALIEDGHYTEEVRRAYSYIGTIALENPKIKKAVENSSAVAKYNFAKDDYESAKKRLEKLNPNDVNYSRVKFEVDKAKQRVNEAAKAVVEAKQNIREIVGRALMDTFDSGKDEIGLAQAFCNRAKRLAKTKGIELNIPFDDSTLWGAVISSLNSKLTKDGIRRKHPGFAGVLNPSHNMIMYYEGEGGAKLWKEFEEECREKLHDKIGAKEAFAKLGSWQKVAMYGYLQGTNPYYERINDWDKIDFEDTFCVYDEKEGKFEKPIVINSFAIYDLVRNQKMFKGMTVFKLKAAPRNLRGCDTLFTIKTNNGTKHLSLYNTDEVRALQYISKGRDMLAYQREFLKENFGFDESRISNEKYMAEQKAAYTSRMQYLLHQIESASQSTIAARLDPNISPLTIKVPKSLGMDVVDSATGAITPAYATVIDYTTRPAEIIMGRYQMEKFGVNDQDHIANIKDENYFIDKITNVYGNFTRISKELDSEDRKKAYDYILFKNGKPVYVKVGDLDPNINDKISKHKLVEYNVVGDDLRIGSEVVLSNTGRNPFPVEDFQFYTVTSSSEPVTYIMCKTQNELKALKNSDYFDDFRLKDEKVEENYIRRIARDRFKAFSKALEYVGARVPTQAMQSFMPFKVLAFSDSEQNVLYVPKHNTFIEGSDYDIDKLYLLARSFSEAGQMYAGTAIQKEIGFEAAVKLSRSDETKIFSEGPSGSFPLNSKILSICGFKQNKEGKWYVYLNNDAKVDNFVYMFNKIYADPSGQITFDESVDENLKEKVIDLFNEHSSTPDFVKNSEEALKMRMFDVIYDITRKIENQHKAQITVDTCTEELKERTKNTASGNAEKRITPYNPASKFMMQEQNQLGKAVVGIGAVSLKTYFILSTNSNTKVLEACDLLDQNPNNIDAVAEKINFIKINRPSLDGNGSVLTTITNTNLDPLIDRLKKLTLAPGDKYDLILKDVLEMKKNTLAISAPEFLSGIISLAADNAKELALPKLNATSDLVDIYTTAAMLGYSFQEISDIMCSPIFNWLTEIGAQNVFDETSLKAKVKDAIGFASLTSDKLYPKSLMEVGIREYNNWCARRIQYYELLLRNPNLSSKEQEAARKEYDQFLSEYKVYRSQDAPWGNDFVPNLIVPNVPDCFNDKAFVNSIVRAFEYDEGYNYYILEKGVWTVHSGAPIIPANALRGRSWSDDAIDDFQQQIDEGEDFSEDGGYNTNRDYSQSDYYRMYRGFKAYQERFNFLPDQNAMGYGNLRFLNKLLKFVEEMSTLGQVGSINQGLKTNINDFYTSTRRIDDFLRRRLVDAKKEAKAKNAQLVLNDRLVRLSEVLESGTFTDRFLTDEVFAEEMVQALEEDRRANKIFFTGFNILDALKNSPNFHAMAKIMPAADEMLKESSAVYRISTRLADRFKVDKNIGRKPSENDFKCISNYVQDYNIYSFIEQAGVRLDLSDFESVTWYKVPKALEKSALAYLDVNDAKSIASFKHIFENYIVPALQKKFGDNIFLKSLIHKSDSRNDTDVVTLPISLMDAQKDIGSSNQYANYLQAFNAIANENFAGNKVGDLFFLYNLVSFKNGFGRNALTKMFEGIVQGKNVPPIIDAYYEFISKQSKTLELTPEMIREAQWYVARNSRFTKIPMPNGMSSPELTSDYTFILPITAKLRDINTPVPEPKKKPAKPEPQNNPIKGEGISKLSMDRVSPLEFIGEFAAYINSQRPNTVSIFSGGEKWKNVRGLVQNGRIYINADKFTDVPSIKATAMHELTHIFLASVKAKDPRKYYDYIAQIGRSSDFDEIAKYYPNSIGTDLQEEIFCYKLEKVLAGSYNPNDPFEAEFVNKIVPQLLNQLDNFSACFAARGDEFIRAMEQNAKLAAVKTWLYNSKEEDTKLEENCNESF